MKDEKYIRERLRLVKNNKNRSFRENNDVGYRVWALVEKMLKEILED